MANDAGITPQERQLNEHLDRIDGEADTVHAHISRNWNENLKLVKGEGQWKAQRTPLFLMNILGNQVERKTAQVSESKPTTQVASHLGHLKNAATILHETTKAILEIQEFPLTVERLCRFGMQMGCCFTETVWDPNAFNGFGDVVVNCIDPRMIRIDRGVTEAAKLQEQAEYIRIDHVMSLNQVKRLYPGRGSLVQADPKYSTYIEKGMQQGVVSAALNLLPRPFRPSETPKDAAIPRTVVQEYWLKDPDTQAWPNGRRIRRAPPDIILMDKANDYWDGNFTIDMVDWRMDLDGPWGTDDIQDLKKLQEALNRMGDAIMRNALFNSQTWIIADHDALDQEQWRKITTEGGLVVKKRPTRDFRRDPPPALPAYLFQMLQAIPDMASLITGIIDTSGKRTPKGGIEAVIDGLQTAQNALARMIARRFESLVARIGQKIIARVVQFYNVDRMLQYYDPSSELVSYQYERSKLLSDDNGKPISGDELTKFFRNFRFMVQPYSSINKMQRAQIGLGLWQSTSGKGYPLREVLRTADVGDPDALMEAARKEQEQGIAPMPAPPTKR